MASPTNDTTHKSGHIRHHRRSYLAIGEQLHSMTLHEHTNSKCLTQGCAIWGQLRSMTPNTIHNHRLKGKCVSCRCMHSQTQRRLTPLAETKRVSCRCMHSQTHRRLTPLAETRRVSCICMHSKKQLRQNTAEMNSAQVQDSQRGLARLESQPRQRHVIFCFDCKH
jgi:hypothetical protein